MLLLLIWSARPATGQDAPGSGEEGADALTLAEGLRLALARSADLRDARLALEGAERQVQEAWGSVFPSLSATAGYTRNVSPAKSFLPAIIFDPSASPDEQVQVQFGADNQWSSSVVLEQPLFQAAAFVGVGAAARFRGLQEEVLRGRSQAVVTRVRLAFYGLLLSEEEARLALRSLDRVREALRETRALGAAGLASEYEVLRLEVEVANLEPVFRQALSAVERQRRDLAVELGLEPSALPRPAGSLATLDLENPESNAAGNRGLLLLTGIEPPAGVPDSMSVEPWVDRRSDVLQLESTELLRRAEMRAQQTEWFPRLSLTGTYLVNAQQNGDPDFFGADASQRNYARSVGFQLSWTLFDGFAREARVARSRTELRRAESQTGFARDRARAQLRSLLEEHAEAVLRARGQALAVRQATRGYEIASAQFREGLGSRLELTDAEVALRQSEFNYARSVFDVLSARARLDEAAGRVPGVDLPLEEGTDETTTAGDRVGEGA